MGKQRINESEMVIFHLYRKLKQITHEIDSYRDGVAKNFGISGASLYVLLSIYTASECSYKDLAAHSGLAPNTVSALVSSLIPQGLVTVTQDSEDRRIGRLRLTELGSQLVEDAWSHTQTDAAAEETECRNWLFNEIINLKDFCPNV